MSAFAKKHDYAVSGKRDTRYPQLNTYYDEKYKAGWFRMSGAPRPCFTPELLSSISRYFTDVRTEMLSSGGKKYDYLIQASDVEGVFNLGGDLNLFSSLIEKRDKKGLLNYAVRCIDVLYPNMTHLETDLTTIALVKGDALGGGFEAALSSNVLIAERGAKMGLPEVLFNLFPGMGAYSMLLRKVGPSLAEEMIMSGQLYSAEQLAEMGVVDVLAEPGEGELAVYRYMDRTNKVANTHQAIRKVKDYCNPISYAELIDITQLWVEAAMNLNARDLRMMHRLVQRQTSKAAS
jgi:DSF synthase